MGTLTGIIKKATRDRVAFLIINLFYDLGWCLFTVSFK